MVKESVLNYHPLRSVLFLVVIYGILSPSVAWKLDRELSLAP